jgi:hypothetical protein
MPPKSPKSNPSKQTNKSSPKERNGSSSSSNKQQAAASGSSSSRDGSMSPPSRDDAQTPPRVPLSRSEPSKESLQFQAKMVESQASELTAYFEKMAQSKSGAERAAFMREMDSFHKLFLRYKNAKASGNKIEWSKIKPPSIDLVAPLDSLPQVSMEQERNLAKKLCVLKLNGGLGKSEMRDMRSGGRKKKNRETVLTT